jgi:hypothetical protein
VLNFKTLYQLCRLHRVDRKDYCGDRWIWKDSSEAYFNVLSNHFIGGAEANQTATSKVTGPRSEPEKIRNTNGKKQGVGVKSAERFACHDIGQLLGSQPLGTYRRPYAKKL